MSVPSYSYLLRCYYCISFSVHSANSRVVTDREGEAEYTALNSGGVGSHVKNSRPFKNGNVRHLTLFYVSPRIVFNEFSVTTFVACILITSK
jgi:hypothetical protein